MSTATALVRDYLAAMEARDLPRAQAMLTADFAMEFPGPARMTTLAELIAWARPRYRFARKTYERFDEAPTDDGTIVYCFGTLAGEWLDGKPFADIRFIDRFTVRNSLLADQKVWNDMAEHVRESKNA